MASTQGHHALEMEPLLAAVRGDGSQSSVESTSMESQEEPALTFVDVDQLVFSIEGMLRGAESRRESPPTIYRVRPSVREENPKAYDPKIISLGPFHRGKDDLEEMQKLKQMFMNHLLRRSPDNAVRKYIDAVLRCEDARAKYSGKIDLDPDEFVKTMVLDGCFLVECLVKRALGTLGDGIALANCNTTLLRNDCLLFENQIPFSVVEALFHESVFDWRVQEGLSPLTPRKLATNFLKISNLPVTEEGAQPVYHLLHLFHSSLNPGLWPNPSPKSGCQMVTRYLGKLINLASPIFYGVLYSVMNCRWPRLSPLDSRRGQNSKYPRMIPCATELREAGIRIKKRHFADPSQYCFLKVSFEDGTLQIPFLSVEESTNSRFRNLVALEQCCPHVGNYFTSYAIFMDNIINTAADVAVLRACGIIESKLGNDKEVAHLFNTVCKGAQLNYDKHYLADVFRAVKDYCETPRHRWRAKLMHDYFNSPWSVISVLVASFLLIFTGIQAIYAVVAYYRPNK